MAKDQRFEKVYSQGTMTTTEIWVDKETGVNYVFHASGCEFPYKSRVMAT